MAEKMWTERDGVPLNKCPECGAFPEDTYDVMCHADTHPDGEGPEFEEVLYVPKALLDEAVALLREGQFGHTVAGWAKHHRAEASFLKRVESNLDERNAE